MLALAKPGYLMSEQRVANGRCRTHYATAVVGYQGLGEVRAQLVDLANEVLRGHS